MIHCVEESELENILGLRYGESHKAVYSNVRT